MNKMGIDSIPEHFDNNEYKGKGFTHAAETSRKYIGFTLEQIKDDFKDYAFSPCIQVHMYRTQDLVGCIAMARKMVPH